MLSEWLQSTLKANRISQAQLARDLTAALVRSIDRAAVNKMIKGTRKIAADELLEIERLTGAQAPKSEASGIPLLSWVSAGSLAVAETVVSEDDAFSYVYEGGLDPSGDWIALRVDGRSMDKISPHDSIIFVNRKEKILVPNACYVIADGEGGATYKRYRPPNKFEPVSTKPDDYSTLTFDDGREPEVIGRVRKTVLSL